MAVYDVLKYAGAGLAGAVVYVAMQAAFYNPQGNVQVEQVRAIATQVADRNSGSSIDARVDALAKKFDAFNTKFDQLYGTQVCSQRRLSALEKDLRKGLPLPKDTPNLSDDKVRCQ